MSTPVVISYPTLVSNPLSLTQDVEKGFGSSPNALGIVIVKDLPATFPAARERLLRLAAKFAALKPDEQEKYVDERSQYCFGWSHGKEIMNGKPDTLKGSYYANPVVDTPTVLEAQAKAYPEYYGTNIWPATDQAGIEGFEDAFKDLGRFIFKVGCELAAACQPFASPHLTDSSLSLPKLISTSQTTKARLLHYFPPSPDASPLEDEPVDSWCGFHLDHSLLTGLCSALYLRDGTDAVSPSSPAAGLYIKTRGGELTQVKIPADCLAFQTGEALELATAGRLRATPHCVRAGGGGEGAERISRETFALFMQPDTNMLVGQSETFGQFSKRVFEEHYGNNAPGSDA